MNEIERSIRMNKGLVPYDKLFTNVNLINVYTETIMEQASVALCGEKICAVNPKFTEASETVDGHGLYMVPGLLDAHMHIETSHLNPFSWAQATLPHGTTTIFCDIMVYANVEGEAAIRRFDAMAERIPTRVFYQIPSRVPALEGLETNGGRIDADCIEREVSHPKVVALGEVNLSSVLQEHAETLAKIRTAKEAGIRINGHCPSFGWQELNLGAAAGITDDHESMTAEELKQKLALGMTVMVREGSIEPNVEALVKGIVEEGLPTDNLVFCTDDKMPKDLVQQGHIDYAVRKAVSCGLPVMKAIKMATLNTAKYFRLDHLLGSITPGRYADFLLVSDLKELKLEQVYISGKQTAVGNRALYEFERSGLHAENTVRLPEELDLRIKAVPFSEKAADILQTQSSRLCRIMKINHNSLEVTEKQAEMQVESGTITADLEADILPIAVIERYGKNGNIGKALIQGLGIRRGAIASSLSAESNNLVTSGTSYSDMECAVKELARIGGGYTIVQDGKVLCSCPMPVGGVMYDCSLEESLSFSEKLEAGLREIGCTNAKTFTYMNVATAPTIPKLGLTDCGLIDAEKQEKAALFLEQRTEASNLPWKK